MMFYALLACGIITALADEDPKKFFRRSRFPLHVYRELIKSNYGNLMVSPLSLEIMLALLQNGAEGPASDEIVKALGLAENSEDTRKVFREVKASLGHHDGYNISNVNKIYITNREVFGLKYPFDAIAKNDFGIGIEISFFEDKAAAVAKINDWVEALTYGYIKNLLRETEVDVFSMVLVNTLFFQGNWVRPFPDEATKEDRFFLDEKDYVNTEIMEVSGDFNYFELSDLKARMLEMFYVGNDISMTIVLPDDREGLSALENAFTESWFFMEHEQPTYVHVRLPKFKIETEIDFVPILKALGIETAFGSGFDQIVPHIRVPISHVKQKTLIDVDEKGTTAAAASPVIDVVRLMQRNSKVVEFFAQHPFLFYIRSYKLGTVLFMGRVTSPSHD